MIVTEGSEHEKQDLERRQESELKPGGGELEQPEAGENSTKGIELNPSATPNEEQHREATKTALVASVTNQKRRSSWRHLLSPSYKSRSDEFHRLFAEELPRGERLLADYSCALHREILLQGRLYVSLNHLAFYSNIFSWVTKLVVRLEDIRDIYKANTAKIIPNAIQIITEQGDKHVFASFIARDKTFVLIKRIWLNERLSDQELRRLVHLGYGKDLGFGSSDLDEAQMLMSTSSSADSTTSSCGSSNTSPVSCSREAKQLGDGNNNNQDAVHQRNQSGTKPLKPLRMRFNSRSQTQKEVLSLIEEADADINDKLTVPAAKLGRSPGSMPAGSASQKVRRAGGVTRRQSDRVVRHLSMRLANLSSLSYHDANDDKHNQQSGAEPLDQVAASAEDQQKQLPDGLELGVDDDDERNNSTSTASSAVVVDTPILVAVNRIRRTITVDSAELEAAGPEQTEADVDEDTSREVESPVGTVPAAAEAPAPADNDDGDTGSRRESARQQPELIAASNEELDQNEGANSGELHVVDCGCGEHVGSLIADEQFDISVDLLFSLIFTNSKFMRAHMIRRGMTRSIVSKWRRSGGGGPSMSQVASGETAATTTMDSNGTRSSSSTLSSRDGATSQWSRHEGQRTRQNSLDSLRALDKQAAKVRSEQERQLSYSMNVNHVLAKQVQVEERQSICLAQAGQVYVLKSTTLNSGFPYSESFTIDLTYCLTRGVTADCSRMKVHGLVNFIKEKNSWRLSMIKPMLEKTSMQGVLEFISDLGQSIRNFATTTTAASSKRRGQQKRSRRASSGATLQNQELGDQQRPDGETAAASRPPSGGNRKRRDSAATPTDQSARGEATRDSRSLTRAKSKLKERKLRHIYKYYIRAGDDDLGHEVSASSGLARHNLRLSQHEHRGGVSPCRHPENQRSNLSTTSRSSCSSATSCSDSSSSLLCEDEVEHDNDSMLIMMTTTNDDDDLEIPKTATTKATSNRLTRSSSNWLRNQNEQATTATIQQRKHPNERSYVTKNLVMALGGGLLLLLTGAVFVLNALVLRRLDQLEFTMRTILDREN